MTKQVGSVEVIGAMIDRLPPVGSSWPMAERVLWLRAMESVLDMVYGPVRQIEIVEGETIELPALRASSAEPTDDDVAAGGSRDDTAEATEVPSKPAVGSERSSSAEPARNVGGRPSKDRPPHIPTNLAMAIEAIKARGPMTAIALRSYVREKYWPGAPDHWAATLYDYVKARKLTRTEDGLFDLPLAAETPGSLPSVRQPVKVAPAVPAPKPTPLPKPFSQGVDFEHNGRKTKLPTSRAYVLAGKLVAVKGQPIGEAFLASNVFGLNTEKNRNDVVDICRGINDALAAVGLRIDYVKGVGLIMKDTGE